MSRARLVLAAAVLVVGCLPPATATATPRAAQTSPSPSEAAAGWTLVRLSPPGVVGIVTGVALIGGEVIAVGSATPPVGNAPNEPAAWTSGDGQSWTAQTLPGNASPGAIIPWGNRALVVGGSQSGRCAHPFATDIWLRDGVGAWQEAPFAHLFCAAGVASAAADPNRAVIVGSGAGDVPYAWSSEDGLHWTDHPRAFPISGLPSAVAVLPAGGFIVTGAGPGSPWVARSTDGTVWEPPALLPVPAGERPSFLVADDNVVRLFVADTTQVLSLLVSSDGATWRATPVPGLSAESLVGMSLLPHGLLALGGTPGLQCRLSADGLAWRPLELPPGLTGDAQITGGAMIGNRAVLVGVIAADNGVVPVAWYGPASLLTP